MVAFVVSILVMLVATAAIFPMMKRRPVGTPLTWGEAMVAAVYVFFIFFWAYGIVPHQWLSLADNEWNWRADRLVSGPGGILESLPIEISYMVIRDIVAVGLYGVMLVANVALWVMWQKRGTKKVSEVETSRYGRPLVKGA